MHQFVSLEKVCFSYPQSITLLFDTLNLRLHTGWTGIVGANGCGKTTLLKLVTGLLIPDRGKILLPGPAYYAEQRTDDLPPGLTELIRSKDKTGFKIKDMLGIHPDWPERWASLSHGERKRCQIGAALYAHPLVLAVDEPSNHLDPPARKKLLDALQSYRGIGLLVSHDREMLDHLCRHTLFLSPPYIDVRNSPYSSAKQEIEKEEAHIAHENLVLKREIKKLKKKVAQQQMKSARADKLKSKRHINPGDHDAKAKKDLARLTGKDAVQGRIHARMKSKLSSAVEQRKNLSFRKDKKLGIDFNAQEIPRHFPLIISSGEIKIGQKVILKFPELIIQQGDKIGILGDNGSGKSTFIEYLRKKIRLDTGKIVFIPQEIPREDATAVLTRVQNLDSTGKGEIMTIISRLGSEPVQLLDTSLPTPGEVRKLMLAEGILRQPAIIVMDEPTNHMDLPSIQCVETALKECPCAQVLVSHDHYFLNNTTDITWLFTADDENRFKPRKSKPKETDTYYIRLI
jgi:macrolide transport system ATP-binding/permease protein